MPTGGFQFNAPAAARLENIQAPKFNFVSGESLVADPGIDMWLKGQQQASENLLSGINIGVRGLTEAVSAKYKQEYDEDILAAKIAREQKLLEEKIAREDRLLEEKILREESDSDEKFLKDVWLADYKSDDKELKNTLTQLQIDEKRREAAALDFYNPLPETAGATESALSETGAPEEGFSAGTTGKFSMGLRETQAPSQPVDGTNLQAEFVDVKQKPSRYQEIDLAPGKVALFDNVIRKIVPGSISDKEEAETNEPVPEGYTKEQFTKKTKTGTETYKKEGTGSQMSDTMITKLAAYRSLNDSMKDIEDQMRDMERGPIVGIFREPNPYDAAAQKLNKLVESVVPGLAKTVFNEVGVLTDADIRRYKAMVPNVKTEMELADGLMNQLKKKIASSYNETLNAAEDAKVDVTGFRKRQEEEKKATDKTAEQSGLYDEIKALRDQVANTSVVDTNRQALIQSIAAKTKEYIQKTGQSPKF